MPLHWLLQSTLEKYIPSSTSLKAHYNLPPNIWKVSVLDSSFRVSNWLLSWPNRLLKKNRGLRKNNKFFHYKRMFQYQNIRCALNQAGNLRLIFLGYYPSRFQYSWSSNSVNSPTVFRIAYFIPDASLVVVYLCCITWPACKSLTKNMFNVLNTFDDRSVPYCVAAKIKEKTQ